MGVSDREYLRTPSTANPQLGRLPMFSVTIWLIIICCIVFVADYVLSPRPALLNTQTGVITMLPRPIEAVGAFTIPDAVRRFQIWRFVTYQFLHFNFPHLLFNMMSLFFFGALIESYLGRRRYLAFYLLSGVGGALMYIILAALGFVGRGSLVGASAGIFGVLIAAAVVAPNATVLVMGSIPAKLKTVVWVFIIFAVFTIFTQGNNAGGEAAHLGGAVVGFILIKNVRWLNIFERYGPKRVRQNEPPMNTDKHG